MTQPSGPPPVTVFDPAVELVARTIRASKFKTTTAEIAARYSEITRRDIEIATAVVHALRQSRMLGCGD